MTFIGLLFTQDNDSTPDGSDINDELANNGGFARNVRRGTAYVFDQAALDSFLDTNGLTHVIRAHEVQPHGVAVSVYRERCCA